jgi:lipid A 3-O-deacylase
MINRRAEREVELVQRFVLLMALIAAASMAAAQSERDPGKPGDGQLVYPNLSLSQTVPAQTQTVSLKGSFDPVAEVRQEKSWEYGPFVNWGTGLGDRSDYKFLSAGFELGKVLTPVVHAGILSGQFQFAGNIMPLWQAYTPAPHVETETCVTSGGLPYSCQLPFGGGTFYGVSLTPVIFRWNFATSSHRMQPWFQAAGGLIYTTHKFPPNFLTNKALGIDGGTSVWNFTPQGGGGIHYFIHPKRSIDLGVNAVHISSASLGDRNPGVNASIQIQVGYTFWR